MTGSPCRKSSTSLQRQPPAALRTGLLFREAGVRKATHVWSPTRSLLWLDPDMRMPGARRRSSRHSSADRNTRACAAPHPASERLSGEGAAALFWSRQPFVYPALFLIFETGSQAGGQGCFEFEARHLRTAFSLLRTGRPAGRSRSICPW